MNDCSIVYQRGKMRSKIFCMPLIQGFNRSTIVSVSTGAESVDQPSRPPLPRRFTMFLKAVAVSLFTLASANAFAAECAVTVESTDQMSYTTQSFTVDKSCKAFTVTLTHSGNLPKNVMGHNLVISKTADAQSIANEGMSQGLDKEYLKTDDPRIIAYTKMIGAPEKEDTITLDLSKLEVGGDYTFFCTFPGHMALMKGNVVVQ